MFILKLVLIRYNILKSSFLLILIKSIEMMKTVTMDNNDEKSNNG